MICGKCKGYNRDGLKFCTGCGEELIANLCPQGHPMPSGTTECPHCPKGGRSKTVAEQNVGLAPPSSSKREGTVMVSPTDLPGGGSSPPTGQPPFTGGHSGNRQGTVFRPAKDDESTSNTPSPVRTSDVSNSGQSPLVGFLVSYTTDKNGVFWPLRVGRTRIGSSINNDIVFANQEVSGEHLVIMVRGKPGKLKIYCTDENSTNGTLLNGEDIANDRPNLSNGDVITIGPVDMKLFMLDG